MGSIPTSGSTLYFTSMDKQIERMLDRLREAQNKAPASESRKNMELGRRRKIRVNQERKNKSS